MEYSNLTTGPEQTQALASGDIQFLYAVGATSVILSASNGADVKIISTYGRSPEAFRLFAGKDSTIQTAADLKGRKFAGPVAYNMAKDGYRVVTTGKDLVDATIVVATSGAFYEKNPLLVKRFLETQSEIAQYMKENAEETLEITARETELSMEAVKEMFPMYDFSTEITEADITSMKKTEQFMKDNGMIENRVDINGLILKID